RDLDAKLFRINNLDYLLARMASESGDHPTAASEFHRVIHRRSILSEYAIWHLSRLFRDSGNRTMERVYLDQLAAMFPDSVLNLASSNRTARSWIEDEDFPRAVAEFEFLSATGTKNQRDASSLRRENQALQANAYLGTGQTDRARELFRTLIAEVQNPQQPDDYALEAARGLDAIDGGNENIGRNAPKLDEAEHMLRAGIYQFNRDFRQARLHYTAVINEHPASTPIPEATFQIGRGLAQRGEFAEAFRWFERLLEQFPEHSLAGDALLQAASAYARTGKHREAVSRYQRYIDQYPDDERADRAYLNIIDVLRDQGQETEALKRSELTQKVFKGKVGEAQALFASARLYLAREDWKSASEALGRLSSLPDLGGSRVPGGTSAAEVTFLLGYADEQVRNYDSAIDRYLALPDGRDQYYGWRATLRLRELAQGPATKPLIENRIDAIASASNTKDPKARKEQLHSLLRMTVDEQQRRDLLERLKSVYQDMEAYKKLPATKNFKGGRKELLSAAPPAPSNRNERIANELAFLGLFDEAAPRLQRVGKAAVPELAHAFLIGGRADRAVSIAESEWRNIPSDFQIELMPRENILRLYPAPYRDSLRVTTAERLVDPRLLLAIMRQESRFQPDVKSVAAARGLMQFISTTSTRIAGELGIDAFRQNDLYDPPIAILFAAQYTDGLFRMFPDQPPAVAASYNGGEDNMKRWMDRSRSMSPDRYVPEIAFSQSKDYVYKVMANYRVYTVFYDRDLNQIDPLTAK
ncbi:MAG: transglycosylase SLT domain-containing protein, partial [Blastocatellia bacterium]|nr:transglycosylase SLT domain-containing protein [Blastocatellia bacterium]